MSSQTKTRGDARRLNRNGGCMLLFGKLFLMMFPLLFIGIGVHTLYKNWQALGWPEVPIIISGSEAQASYDEDSESGEKTWSIDVRLHFTGTYQGKAISGNFLRSSRFGSSQPTPDEVEKQRRATLASYLRDGMTARVNPADTTQTMVEPSLIGPFFMIVFGLILLVFIVRKHKEILEEAD
ncbi:MAG: hypothetical protein CVV41_15495 [Candidatus Riflebacteria bacterium HGW-Riflebacteria-1]|jgi:hypothetical protein|nr:MAG: hypothetical protein CVV41_15495 [Candidatus Riflebacteria bacterium HGW-Riflebacteria-1]